MNKLNIDIREKIALGLLLILGLLVRLRGVMWGFPYLYHPDEPVLIRTAMGFRYTGFNPNHFDWPTLYMYLNYIIYEVFIKVRAVINMLDLSKWVIRWAPILYNDDIVFYFISRLFTITLAVITLWLVYYICKLLKFNTLMVFLALILLVFSPLHLSESPLATLDVPLAFWLTLTILLSLLSIKRSSFRLLLLAGLATGAAASTKYNGALGVLILLPALINIAPPKTWLQKNGLRICLLTGLAVIGGFLMGTPYAVLDAETFFSHSDPSGALWQFTRGGNSSGLGIIERVWQRIFVDLSWAVGSLTIALAFAGSVIAWRRRHQISFLIPFSLVYAVIIIFLGYYQPHFLLPLIVPLILLAVYFVQQQKGLIKITLALLLLLTIFPSALKQIVTSGREDTRTTMTKYIENSIPSGQKILLGNAYEPIITEKTDSWDGEVAYELHTFREYQGPYNRSLVETLLAKNIRYVVIGDYGLGDQFDSTAPADNHDRLSWLKKYGIVVKRVEPNLTPGPSVILLKLDVPKVN